MQQQQQTYKNLKNAHKEMLDVRRQSELIKKQLQDLENAYQELNQQRKEVENILMHKKTTSVQKQSELVKKQLKDLENTYQELEEKSEKIENILMQKENDVLEYGRKLIFKDSKIDIHEGMYEDRTMDMLLGDPKKSSNYINQIGVNMKKHLEEKEKIIKEQNKHFDMLDKNLTDAEKKVHGIRVSEDGSRNYGSQVVDQNRYCLSYNKETGKVEDPMNYEPIESENMVIRIVTIDGRHKPIYQCYNIESLYDWVVNQGYKFNPVKQSEFTELGQFDDASVTKIKEKYNNYMKNKTRI